MKISVKDKSLALFHTNVSLYQYFPIFWDDCWHTFHPQACKENHPEKKSCP